MLKEKSSPSPESLPESTSLENLNDLEGQVDKIIQEAQHSAQPEHPDAKRENSKEYKKDTRVIEPIKEGAKNPEAFQQPTPEYENFIKAKQQPQPETDPAIIRFTLPDLEKARENNYPWVGAAETTRGSLIKQTQETEGLLKQTEDTKVKQFLKKRLEILQNRWKRLEILSSEKSGAEDKELNNLSEAIAPEHGHPFTPIVVNDAARVELLKKLSNEIRDEEVLLQIDVKEWPKPVPVKKWPKPKAVEEQPKPMIVEKWPMPDVVKKWPMPAIKEEWPKPVPIPEKTEKEQLFIADISPIVKRYAETLAKQKVTELLSTKTHWYSRWIPRQGEKWLETFYTKQIQQEMSKPETYNLLLEMTTKRLGGKVEFSGPTDPNKIKHFEVLDAVIEEFVEGLATEKELSGDKIVNDNEVNNALGIVFRDYATGALADRDGFEKAVRISVIPVILNKNYKFATGEMAQNLGLMYANNFFKLAEGYRQYAQEHIKVAGQEFGPDQLANIEKHIHGTMNLDIQLGAREKDLYENKPQEALKWYEKFVDATQSCRYLNKLFANPLAYAMVGGVMGNAAGNGLARLAGRTAGAGAGVGIAAVTGLAVAPWLAPFLIGAMGIAGGALASGAYMKSRRQRDLQYDRGQALREGTLGVEAPAQNAQQQQGFFKKAAGGIYRFLGGGTEQKVREYVYDTKSGQDILNDLAKAEGSLEAAADAMARIETQREKNVDLITTTREAGDAYKTKMVIIKDEKGKVTRKGIAETLIQEDVRKILALMGLSKQDFAAGKFEKIAYQGQGQNTPANLRELINQRKQALTENIKQIDENFDKYKKHEGNKAFFGAAIMGLAGGVAAQEIYKRIAHLAIGIIPSLEPYIGGMEGKSTILEKGWGAIAGSHGTSGGKLPEFGWIAQDTGKGKLQIPDLLGYQDTNGQFVKGSADANGIWHDAKGASIYDQAKGQLIDQQWQIKEEYGPTPGVKKMVPAEDWLKTLPDTADQRVVKISHEGWYDNDTKMPDKNERRIHFGGARRAGLDENGNIALDISKMKAYDSWNSKIGRPKGSVNVKDLISKGKIGPIKALFYPTGKSGTVLEVDLQNTNGLLKFDKGNDVSKFFKILDTPNKAGVKVDFLATMEIAQEIKDESGVRHIIPLATVKGSGMGNMEIIEAALADKKLVPPAITEAGLPPLVSPVDTPFYGRKPLEAAPPQSEKKEQDKPKPGPTPPQSSEKETGGNIPPVIVPAIIIPKPKESIATKAETKTTQPQKKKIEADELEIVPPAIKAGGKNTPPIIIPQETITPKTEKPTAIKPETELAEEELMNDYNNYSAEKDKGDFFKKYSPARFGATNYMARRQNLDIEPIFKDRNDGEMLAIVSHSGKIYAVPRFDLTFDEVMYGPGAMGDKIGGLGSKLKGVFECPDFDPQKGYTVEVARPAIFQKSDNNKLILIEQGKLILHEKN